MRKVHNDRGKDMELDVTKCLSLNERLVGNVKSYRVDADDLDSGLDSELIQFRELFYSIPQDAEKDTIYTASAPSHEHLYGKVSVTATVV